MTVKADDNSGARHSSRKAGNDPAVSASGQVVGAEKEAAGSPHGDHPGSSLHEEAIHLPGNSYIPLATALSFAAFMIGLLAGPWLMAIGAISLIASLVAWVRVVRDEYKDLPE